MLLMCDKYITIIRVLENLHKTNSKWVENNAFYKAVIFKFEKKKRKEKITIRKLKQFHYYIIDMQSIQHFCKLFFSWKNLDFNLTGVQTLDRVSDRCPDIGSNTLTLTLTSLSVNFSATSFKTLWISLFSHVLKEFLSLLHPH